MSSGLVLRRLTEDSFHKGILSNYTDVSNDISYPPALLEDEINSGSNDNTQIEFSKRDRWSTFIIMLLTGAVALIGWNSLLNILTILLEVVYKESGPFTDTMTATYFTVLCCVTLFLSWIGNAYAWLLICGMVGMAVLSIALALICTYVPVRKNEKIVALSDLRFCICRKHIVVC